jgi:hypothetical protein
VLGWETGFRVTTPATGEALNPVFGGGEAEADKACALPRAVLSETLRVGNAWTCRGWSTAN